MMMTITSSILLWLMISSIISTVVVHGRFDGHIEYDTSGDVKDTGILNVHIGKEVI